MFGNLLSAAYWQGQLLRAAQGLLLAIPVALLFELLAVGGRRYALRRLAPALARGGDREPAERARRRRTLRDLTCAGVRLTCNIAAVVVIFALWRLDPLAVVLLVLAVGAVTAGLWRDVVAGYALLLDDCLAPGDTVRINGGPVGQVAEVGLRRLRLRGADGETWLPYSAVVEVVVLARATAPDGSQT